MSNNAELIYSEKEIVTKVKVLKGVQIELTLFQAQFIRSVLGYFGTQGNKELSSLLNNLNALGFRYEMYTLCGSSVAILKNDFEVDIIKLLKKTFPQEKFD